MRELLVVFLGGGVGSCARWLVGRGSVLAFGAGLPYGTFLVNVLGSFLLGALLHRFSLASPAPVLQLALTTGAMGGFTTYSAFNAEVLHFLDGAQYGRAVAYLGATVVACLVAGAAGAMLSRTFAS